MDYVIPPDLVRGPERDLLPLADEANWGIKTFDVQRLRDLPFEPVKVAVIDTGIDRDHLILAPCFREARDFTGSSNGYFDVNGHGTHCSGTVAGVNPAIGVADGFPLYHGKGLSDGGSGSTSGLIGAMDWAINKGCMVLSCSWGGGGPSDSDEAAYRRMAESGAIIVAAAGNSGPNTIDADYPGRYQHVIDVAALNPDLTPAGFTNAGDKLDTSGPGVNIWSARPGGGYAQMSGTSMATPFVAGVIARYFGCLLAAGKPLPNVYDLRKILLSDSTDTHTPGDDRRTGPGWITPLLLTLNVTRDPKPIG